MTTTNTTGKKHRHNRHRHHGDRHQESRNPDQNYTHSGDDNIIGMIVSWVFSVLSIPFQILGFVLEQFTQLNMPGTKILGAIAFLVGTLLGADNFWQLFGGQPLFPWYEESWIGLFGYVRMLFQPWMLVGLVLTMILSGGTQAIEGIALRGKQPDEAKQAFQETMKYKLPEQPIGRIDLSKAAWKDYKRSGMKDRSMAGLLAFSLWAFDFVSGFTARWPFQYEEPGKILMCLFYVLFSIFAGEAGYKLWRLTASKQ